MKRVFLIDAMSHIYRAFFAPMGMRQDPLRNSKGQVTQAVFVFTNMLRKLLNDVRADEAGDLDPPQPGGPERVDQPHLLSGSDHLGLVLKAVSRADFADSHPCGKRCHTPAA